MILTDEREAVLNSILVAVRHAGDHYNKAVELLENHPSADLFAELLHSRRAAATQLAELLRAFGFLPAEPDPDRLALDELATRVKAALAQDVTAILEHKALQRELQIEQQLGSALEMEWPESAGAPLGRLLEETRSQIERLRALKKA